MVAEYWPRTILIMYYSYQVKESETELVHAMHYIRHELESVTDMPFGCH